MNTEPELLSIGQPIGLVMAQLRNKYDSWTVQGHDDVSNTKAYDADAPTGDYKVEPYADADLKNAAPLAASGLVQKRSFIEPTTVELYKPWPVLSHFASHEKGADAWTDKAHDKSNEIAYGADGPTDYTVEAYTDAELSNPPALLAQKRSFIQPTTV